MKGKIKNTNLKEVKKIIQKARDIKKGLPSNAFFSKKSSAGFTMLELFASIFIIVVGAVAILSAILASLSVTFVSSSRLVAAYLAQEGIEIVRNIRETNWLKIHKGGLENWDDGIFCCMGSPCECQGDYSSASLAIWNDEFLKISGGFYGYTGTNNTKFKRKISVNKIATDQIDVSVYIFWQERGQSFQIEVQEKLYDWK